MGLCNLRRAGRKQLRPGVDWIVCWAPVVLAEDEQPTRFVHVMAFVHEKGLSCGSDCRHS